MRRRSVAVFSTGLALEAPVAPPVLLGFSPAGGFTVAGSLAAGESFTVTKATGGFGATGPELYVYDDFDNTAPGGEILIDNAVRGAWSFRHAFTTPTARAGGRSAASVSSYWVCGGIGTYPNSQLRINFPTTQRNLFIAYYARVEPGMYFPGNLWNSGRALETFSSDSSWKFTWLEGPSGNNTPSVYDICTPTYTGGGVFQTAGNTTQPTNRHIGSGWWRWNEWMRFAFEIKDPLVHPLVATTQITSDGGGHTYIEHEVDPVRTSIPLESYSFTNINIPGWLREHAGNNFDVGAVYDDIYIAGGSAAASRVEVTNSATYHQATKIEIMLPDNWSDTGITVTAPRTMEAGVSHVHITLHGGERFYAGQFTAHPVAQGFLAAAGFAVTGDFVEGGTITLTDASNGFGATGPTLLYYDDYSTVEAGENALMAGQLGVGYSTSGTPKPVHAVPAMPYGRGLVIGSTGDAQNSTSTGRLYIRPTDNQPYSEFYEFKVTHWPEAHVANAAPYLNSTNTWQVKGIWHYMGPTGYANGQGNDIFVASGLPGYYTGSGTLDGYFLNSQITGSNEPPISSSNTNGGAQFAPLPDRIPRSGPNVTEAWFKAAPFGQQPIGSDGMYRHTDTTVGLVQNVDFADTGYFTGSASPNNQWDRLTITGYERGFLVNQQCNGYYGQVYIAIGPGCPARVMITDTANYNDAQYLSVCTVNSWAVGAVTATVKTGFFHQSGLENKHLHVFDANNNGRYLGQFTTQPVVQGFLPETGYTVTGDFTEGGTITVTRSGGGFGTRPTGFPTPLHYDTVDQWFNNGAESNPNTALAEGDPLPETEPFPYASVRNAFIADDITLPWRSRSYKSPVDGTWSQFRFDNLRSWPATRTVNTGVVYHRYWLYVGPEFMNLWYAAPEKFLRVWEASSDVNLRQTYGMATYFSSNNSGSIANPGATITLNRSQETAWPSRGPEYGTAWNSPARPGWNLIEHYGYMDGNEANSIASSRINSVLSGYRQGGIFWRDWPLPNGATPRGSVWDGNPANFAPYGARTGGEFGLLGPDKWMVASDIYSDLTPQRVEISDTAELYTHNAQRRLPYVTSWSDTQITVKVSGAPALGDRFFWVDANDVPHRIGEFAA